jgi:hypothetical protein
MLRSDTARNAQARTARSRKHGAFDEGPPGNPVIDAETARLLLEKESPDA